MNLPQCPRLEHPPFPAAVPGPRGRWNFKCAAALLLVALAGLATSPCARADYSSTVQSDAPAGYWRLADTPTYVTAANQGSGGTGLNGQYLFGPHVSATGALAGDSNASATFDGGWSRLDVPYSAAVNPSGPFSVEFWAMLTDSVTTNAYRSPLCSREGGSHGYLFYANTANRWSFWTGSGAWSILDGPPVQPNVWTHVVGTRDSLGTNRLYINGVLVASNSAPAFVPNTTSPLRIGAGANETAAGNYFWPGQVDEVAFYNGALSDAQISSHYSNGTNALRPQPYQQLVGNDGPVGYWRLDEPAASSSVLNQGSLGGGGNGIFVGSPATLVSGSGGALSDSSTGMLFQNATTAPFGARIEVPYSATLNGSTFTAECWANVPSTYRDYQVLMASGTDSGGPTKKGFILYLHNNSGSPRLEFWLGMNSGWTILPAAPAFILGNWNHVVATYDGTNAMLYLNNELAGSTTLPAPYVPNPSFAIRFGAGNLVAPAGNYYLNGSLDEAAIYTTALSPAAVTRHYVAAFSSPPGVYTPPTFVLNPRDTSLPSGATLTLSSLALGGLPMQYQWQKDGVDLPGQTTATLRLNNVSASDSGAYTATASNAAGPGTSTSANIVVAATAAPSLVVDLPGTVTAYTGSSPALAVQASGSLPLTYLWYSNNVLSATTSDGQLVLGGVQASYNGAQYKVVVTNSYGSATSSTATLVVPAGSGADYAGIVATNHPLAYWRLGETAATSIAHDSWGGYDGMYTNVSQHYLPGALPVDDDGAAQFLGGGAGSRVIVPNNSVFDLAPGLQGTVSAWIRPESLTGIQRVFSMRGVTSSGTGGWACGLNGATAVRFTAFNVKDVDGPVGTALGTGISLSLNQWYHIAATYSNTTVVIYLNGVPLTTNVMTAGIYGPVGQPLMLGGNPTGGAEEFKGEIDEAAFFGSVLPAATIKALYNSRSGVPVSVLQDPSSVQLLAGATARFAVGTAGSEPKFYQWYTNGQPALGATNAQLVLPNVAATTTPVSVWVAVSNSVNAVTSGTCTMMVYGASQYAAEVVKDQPVSYWRLDEASGPVVHDYWSSHNGLGEGNLTFNAPGVLSGDSDTALTFDGSAGTKVDVAYDAALNGKVFTIELWARFTGPTGTGTYRSPLTSRDTGGRGYMFYAGPDDHWQFWTGPGGNPWQAIVGPAIVPNQWAHLVGTITTNATGVTKSFYVNGQLAGTVQTVFDLNTVRPLRIGAGSTENAGDFFFPGDVDEVAYYPAVLSAGRIQTHYMMGLYGNNTAPFFIQNPVAQTLFVGQTATLSAQVGGSVPLAYQWQKDGTDLSGATNATLVIASAGYADTGNYTLRVVNPAGQATSSAARLAVMPLPLFANLTNGLVLHLAFEGSPADSSGHGNNGTENGAATYVAGQVGSQARHVATDTGSGTYSYVSLGSPADLQFGPDANFSVSYWVRLGGGSADIPFLASTYGGYGTWGLWLGSTTNGGWSWSLGNWASFVGANGPANSIRDGQWHNLVHTFDRTGNAVTYLDGTQVDSRADSSAGDINNGQVFNIGQDSTGAYAPATGTGAADIDDLGVWGRVLSPYEAQSLYLVGRNSGRTFDTYGPIVLQLNKASSGWGVVWPAGTLLQADDLNGSWTPVPGATAPYYPVSPTAPRKFFRAQP